MNLYCTCSQLSFEVYISCLAQNLKFLPFLVWKISFLTFVIWQLVAAKVYNWRGCFWCLWKAKDHNIYLRTSFGQKLACLVNLWSLKYGLDDLAPSQVCTSFQSPGPIGLKLVRVLLNLAGLIVPPGFSSNFNPPRPRRNLENWKISKKTWEFYLGLLKSYSLCMN